MANDISPEEFERWVRPEHALEILRRITSLPNRVEAILSCVRAGHMRVAARTVSAPAVAGISEGGRYEFSTFPPEWLINSRVKNYNDAFWQFGMVDVSVPATEASSRMRLVNLFDVRFETSGIEGILTPDFIAVPDPTRSGTRRIDHFAHMRVAVPDPAPTPPLQKRRAVTAESDQLPKVSRTALLAWLENYGARNPGLSAAQYAAAAKAQFAGFRVTRQPLRDAIGELNLGIGVGNPAIRQKNRRIGTAD